MFKKFSLLFLLAHTALHSMVPGTLDTTFNPNGIQPGTVTTTINNFTAYFQNTNIPYIGLGIQDDGKSVIAGTINNGDTAQFAVARFNTDGSLDTSFNSAGAQPGTAVVPIINNSNNICSSVAIQSDGKIVLGGYASDGDANAFTVARFNSDGSLDTTFNSAGTESGVPGAAMQGIGVSNVTGYSIAIQSDGKIVIVGYTNNIMAAARFNADGTPDTTFNAAGSQPGTITLPVVNGEDTAAYAVALTNDGKIVLAGYGYDGTSYTFAVAQLTADGILDTSFNSSGTLSNVPGIVLTSIDRYDYYNYAFSVIVQPDNKIVAVGTYSDEFYGFAAARFNTDGSLDTSFNPAGIQPGTLHLTPAGSLYSYASALGAALQNDGKIVMAGFVYIPFNYTLQPYQFGYARLNPNGISDAAFNPAAIQPGSGTTTINNWASTYAYAYAVAIQKNGKIMLAGLASPDSSTYYFALARLNGVDTNNTFSLELINKYSSIVQ